MDCAAFADVGKVGLDDGIDDAPDVVGVFWIGLEGFNSYGDEDEPPTS